MIRESKTRHGRLKIGYIWAFLEPILFVFVLTSIFYYVGSGAGVLHEGMPTRQFFLTGLLAYFLFQNIVIQSMSSINANLELLYYPQVQIFDLSVARTILETMTFFIVMILLTLFIWFSGLESVNIDDPLRIILAVVMIASFGYGIGTALGAIVPSVPVLQFLVQAVYLRPMFFISGIFYTAAELPAGLRDYLLINPLFQMIELMRSAFFQSYESDHINYIYIFSMILLSILSGLLIQRAFRRHAFKI